MNLLQLIFALVYKFVPIDETEFTKLKNEATEEWTTIDITKEDTELKGKSKVMYVLKKNTASWQARLGMSILYILATRWIQDFMNPTDQDD